jgi:Fe/S biogenesis protein NfuA
MQNTLQYETLKNFINEKISPGVEAHGGQIDIVNLEQNVLTLQLSGSCVSCSIQAYSSEAISNYILEEFPDLDDVIVSE